MKTKKIIPQSVAPVKRENVATVSREGKSAIAPSHNSTKWGEDPFAGDDAE